MKNGILKFFCKGEILKNGVKIKVRLKYRLCIDSSDIISRVSSPMAQKCGGKRETGARSTEICEG